MQHHTDKAGEAGYKLALQQGPSSCSPCPGIAMHQWQHACLPAPTCIMPDSPSGLLKE
jgi:hypothetical protein